MVDKREPNLSRRRKELLKRCNKFFELDQTTGNFYFKDPLTGGRIEPGKTLKCIEDQDPIARDGLAYLKKPNSPALQIILAPHTDEQDFTTIATRYSGILLAADCVGIETNWQDGGEPQFESPDTGRGQFQRAQYTRLREQGKQALPFDIDYPTAPSETVGTLRKILLDLFHLPRQLDVFEENERKTIKALLVCAYHQIREPMMIGQLGYWLSEKKDTYDPTKPVPMIVGPFHEPLADFVTQYTGRAPEVLPTDERNPYGVIFREIVLQGYATPKQIEALLPMM